MTDNVTPIEPVKKVSKEGGAGKDTAAVVKGPQPKTDPNKGPDNEMEALRKRAKSAEDKVHELNRKLSTPSVTPVARPAQMKKRHWGVMSSFILAVVAPLVGAILYLAVIAEDQYVSTAGFTVRSQEGATATDLLGGLASFTGGGGGTGSDSAILYEFIQSQEIVKEVDDDLDLLGHYSAHWPRDWAFAIWPDATLEDLTWYWHRIVSIAYDSGSGLTEVQVTAYDRDIAQAITRAIVMHSQNRINALNEQAREDAMRYARADLDEALERLKAAREALIQFRTRTRIVDPQTDIQGRMGVMNNLQQQLAEALVEFDLLSGSVPVGDPRLETAQRLIAVIRGRIEQERTSFASDSNADAGGAGETYPSMISEFERLSVDLQFAEESYRVALTSLELARDEATRQSRYLATYINPTRAEASEYPNRFMLGGLIGLVLLMTWSIVILVYYSIRDRR